MRLKNKNNHKKYNGNSKNKTCKCKLVEFNYIKDSYYCECGYTYYPVEIDVCEHCESDFIYNKGIRTYDDTLNKYINFCSNDCYNTYYNVSGSSNKVIKIKDKMVSCKRKWKKENKNNILSNSSSKIVTYYSKDYYEKKKEKKNNLKIIHSMNYKVYPDGINTIIYTEWCNDCGNTKIDCECHLLSVKNNEVDLDKNINNNIISNKYECMYCGSIQDIDNDICEFCGFNKSELFNNDINFEYEEEEIISMKDEYDYNNTCKCINVTPCNGLHAFTCKCGFMYELEQIGRCDFCHDYFIIGKGYPMYIGEKEYEVCSRDCLYYNGGDIYNNEKYNKTIK